MDEMPQAEGLRARQEHGVLVARGLAEGVAKIVEEATFTDALGTSLSRVRHAHGGGFAGSEV
jgi:hypothetical protein